MGKSIFKVNKLVRFNGPLSSVLYSRGAGMVVTTFLGGITVYDQMTFKTTWEYVEKQEELKGWERALNDTVTMTISRYSEKIG
jgi:hypothetical protein